VSASDVVDSCLRRLLADAFIEDRVWDEPLGRNILFIEKGIEVSDVERDALIAEIERLRAG
jgi:hypothetical protein